MVNNKWGHVKNHAIEERHLNPAFGIGLVPMRSGGIGELDDARPIRLAGPGNVQEGGKVVDLKLDTAGKMNSKVSVCIITET